MYEIKEYTHKRLKKLNDLLQTNRVHACDQFKYWFQGLSYYPVDEAYYSNT